MRTKMKSNARDVICDYINMVCDVICDDLQITYVIVCVIITSVTSHHVCDVIPCDVTANVVMSHMTSYTNGM